MISRIRKSESVKLKEFIKRAKDEGHGMNSLAASILAPAAPPTKLMISSPQTRSPQLGYPVGMRYSTHHVIFDGQPRVEPNAIPEKPCRHQRSVDFDKFPRMYPHLAFV